MKRALRTNGGGRALSLDALASIYDGASGMRCGENEDDRGRTTGKN